MTNIELIFIIITILGAAVILLAVELRSLSKDYKDTKVTFINQMDEIKILKMHIKYLDDKNYEGHKMININNAIENEKFAKASSLNEKFAKASSLNENWASK